MVNISSLSLLLFLLVSCSENKELPEIYLEEVPALNDSVKQPVKFIYAFQSEKTELPALIKKRGGMSIGFPKPNFTVKTEANISLCKLPKSRNWILNASYIDKSFIRHKLSFEFFKLMNQKNISPGCGYAKVFVNTEYMGNYVVMEKMDEQRLSVTPSGLIFKNPPVFYHPDSVLNNYQPQENYYHQKYPKTLDLNLNSEMDSLRNFLFNASDAQFGDSSKGVFSKFDMNNIIDWHILLLVTNSGDGMLKNFYLFKQHKDSLIKICPWDYDHTFGRDGDNEKNLESVLNYSENILLKRAVKLNSNGYRDKLVQRYWHLIRQSIMSPYMMKTMVAREFRNLQPFVAENEARWPVNGPHYFDDYDFYQEHELIKDWIDVHMKRVYRQINGIANLSKQNNDL